MTSIETIKELLARATTGEWYIRNPHSGDVRILASGDRDKTPAATICQMANWLDHELRERDANAALIAAAPNIAAAYIEQAATIARLTAERDRLREALEICAGSGPKKLNLHEDFLRREAVARAALKEG